MSYFHQEKCEEQKKERHRYTDCVISEKRTSFRIKNNKCWKNAKQKACKAGRECVERESYCAT